MNEEYEHAIFTLKTPYSFENKKSVTDTEVFRPHLNLLMSWLGRLYSRKISIKIGSYPSFV